MTKSAPIPKTLRSRVTNGATPFFDAVIDGRSAEARRFRDVLSSFIADLGPYASLSEAQRQLARRAAMLSMECERMENDHARGLPIDPEAYGRATDRLSRVVQRLNACRPRQTRKSRLAEIIGSEAAE